MNVEILDWNTAVVTSMSVMFQGATAFDCDISGLIAVGVTNMSYMFRRESKFDVEVLDRDIVMVTDMSVMFQRASISIVIS